MEIPIKYEDLQLDKACRICLIEQEDLEVMSELVSEKLIECASIQLPTDNVLLCKSCENEINKWHAFKQQVTRAFEICEAISAKICISVEPEPPELIIKAEEIVENEEETEAVKYKCAKCLHILPTYAKLRSHLKVHKMEEGYNCVSCNKKFCTAQALWRHKRRHNESKRHPCPDCPMAFPFKYGLDRHFQAKHALGANFLCSYCPRTYKVRETLMAHVKKCHSGDTAGAVCNVCGKFCVSLANLKVHLRSHTGERPYECDFCKKGFMTKDHMVLHRRIHTGERPFVCDECGKGFISSSVLRKHKRAHTGERPYQCHLCDKSFSLSSAFKAHLKCH